MHWIYLTMAGIFEIGWAVGLKQMDGHKNLSWTIIFYISIITSFYFLQLALKSIPVSTAYAIYTGIGTLGTVMVSILFLKEPISFAKVGCMLCIVGGVIGLKLSTNF
ncbi:MAG: multidrug efflux SMR transporter [Bacteroidia bacterium]|nr:multidrug efflux SMR transporter [Bacteroidia bacterium]